jgi:RNA polymerase sigma-70 factor (ECF subfamily)
MMTYDEQLLARAKQLDPDALRALHERFYEPVARYVQFKVGDTQTVEDLTGEVFVRVIEGLRRGRAWQDSLQGWIMGIARHVVADHYRQRERSQDVVLDERLASPDEHDPAQQLLRSERQRLLSQAIDRLTEDQRDVILLRFREGIDIKGVANAVDKSPSAVKSLQARALQALARMMQDLSDEEIQEETNNHER